MKEKIILCTIILLLIGTGFSQIYEISSQKIIVEVNKNGEASIQEKFYLTFPNTYQVEKFREESKELGSSLDAWRNFDSSFYPHIGTASEITSGIVNPTLERDGAFYYFELTYDLSSPIMHKTDETSRMITYVLEERAISEFFSGNLVVIPKGTTISFVLPQSTEIRKVPQPEATTWIREDGKKVVNWTGYKSANAFILEYAYWKQIAPSLEISMLFYSLMTSEGLPPILGLLILLALAVYWKKKEIGSRLENYIIDHSDMEKTREDNE